MSPGPDERQRFGRYETLFRIARGGMAEVYAARAWGEGGFQKIVALKRMRPELAEDARFVTMFLDEGRTAANIASPNVVSTLDMGRADDNSLYLVMELVTGISLQRLMTELRLRQVAIPVGIAVEMVAQAANGLHGAHEARSPVGDPLEIVHRDCSPHNILVDVLGQVKITDFGIAKALERQTRSQVGEMKGKLSYLSPEQARGKPLDRRSDIFTLGVVGWELLAGRQLFDANNAVEAIHKVVSMPIPRIDEARPEVSGAVAEALAQALARDPDERFASAAAFANALRNALGARSPSPSEIGEFVRAHGGDALRLVEQGIRQALGAKIEVEEAPTSNEYPIPLSVRSSSDRLRPPVRPKETVGFESGDPAARVLVPVLDTRATSEPAETASAPPAPSEATDAQPRESDRSPTSTRYTPKHILLPVEEPEWETPPSRRSSGDLRFSLIVLLVLALLGSGALAAWWTSRGEELDPSDGESGTESEPATPDSGAELPLGVDLPANDRAPTPP